MTLTSVSPLSGGRRQPARRIRALPCALVVCALLTSSTLFAQPMNDECAQSVALVNGANNVSNLGSTFSGTESTCPTTAISQADPDT